LLVSVNVVDFFILSQWTTEESRHDKAMLEVVFLRADMHDDIAVAIDVSAALPRRAALFL
jgi:hypothetical protein